MKISFSLSGFTKGVVHLSDLKSPEFRKYMLGKPVYVDRYKYIGYITDIDPEKDLIYAEIPDVAYEKMILDARCYNMCSFEIIRKECK